MEDCILKRNKKSPKELLNPIILLERPEKDYPNSTKHVDHTCYNIPDNPNSEKYVSKILIFYSGTPEEWIIFGDLVQKSLVGQNITTEPPIYK